jgi:hypothetical protein
MALAVAAVLAVVVGALAIILPKVFASDSQDTSANVASTANDSASPTDSASASTSTTAPVGKVPTNGISNACTYEILAAVDTREHKKSTTTAVPPGSPTDVLTTALQQRFQALLKSKDATSAVKDTITTARQMCDDSGNPLLTREQVQALKTVAPTSDIALLNQIVVFAPSADDSTAVTLPLTSASSSGP